MYIMVHISLGSLAYNKIKEQMYNKTNMINLYIIFMSYNLRRFRMTAELADLLTRKIKYALYIPVSYTHLTLPTNREV